MLLISRYRDIASLASPKVFSHGMAAAFHLVFAAGIIRDGRQQGKGEGQTLETVRPGHRIWRASLSTRSLKQKKKHLCMVIFHIFKLHSKCFLHGQFFPQLLYMQAGGLGRMKRSDFISSPSPRCLPALPLSLLARTRCIEGKEILSMGATVSWAPF